MKFMGYRLKIRNVLFVIPVLTVCLWAQDSTSTMPIPAPVAISMPNADTTEAQPSMDSVPTSATPIVTNIPLQRDTKPNVAVIDFTGDQTVTPEQLSYITGKMASELVTSDQFTVLDRSRMDYILKEQGFQQSGACDSKECRVQVGQLLGVDFIVAGTLVKFGPTYIVRIDYIDVETGKIVKSVDLQKKGDLYEIVNDLCQEGVGKLLDALNGKHQQVEAAPIMQGPASAGIQEAERQVPADALPKVKEKRMSAKRKVAVALWGTSLASAGAGYYFDWKGAGYRDEYQDAEDSKDSTTLFDRSDKMSDMETYRNTSYGISIGSALLGLLLWFLPEDDQ